MTSTAGRSPAPTTVLIVSADAVLASRLGAALLAAGFSVGWETTPASAETRLRRVPQPELLVLDVPRGRLRAFAPLFTVRPETALLLVDQPDPAAACQAAVSLARSAAESTVVERLQFIGLRAAPDDEPVNIRVGPLLLDLHTRTATCAAAPVTLTWCEFDLLWMLAANAGRVISRASLHSRITGTPYGPAARSIDVHVCRLRRKLDAAGFTGATVTAVRSQGYILLTTEAERLRR